MKWTESFQRAYLGAVLGGMVGHRLDVCAVNLFTAERQTIAQAIHAFAEKYGEWPAHDILPTLVPSVCGPELGLIRRQTRGSLKMAADEGSLLLRREALRHFALAVDAAAAEGSPEEWGTLGSGLQEALSLGSPSPKPFVYDDDLESRQRPQAYKLTAPTGIPPLDEAREGGLHEGEMGFIMGSTGLGKSQFCVHFGTQHLLSGGKVLHLSLEMPAFSIAARYDRSITGFDRWEIREDYDRARRTLQERLDRTALDIRFFPRGTLPLAGVHRMVKEVKDKWQTPPLVIVDYFSLLKKEGDEKGYVLLSSLAEGLSAIAQEEQVAVWSPFQMNREGYKKHKSRNDTGDLSDAGGSYDATTHADYIIALNQSQEDKVRGRMDVQVTKERSNTYASASVGVDWSRSRVLFERVSA